MPPQYCASRWRIVHKVRQPAIAPGALCPIAIIEPEIWGRQIHRRYRARCIAIAFEVHVFIMLPCIALRKVFFAFRYQRATSPE